MDTKNIDDIMNTITYGYKDINGNIHNDADSEFSELYRLQSPAEVLKSKVGVCWDQVELEREQFDKINVEFDTYFIAYYDDDKCPTHTFLVYRDNNKFCWYENSWEIYKGKHYFSSLMQLLKDIKNKFINQLPIEDINSINDKDLCIYKYTKPNYGISCIDFYRHCENGKNIIV